MDSVSGFLLVDGKQHFDSVVGLAQYTDDETGSSIDSHQDNEIKLRYSILEQGL